MQFINMDAAFAKVWEYKTNGKRVTVKRKNSIWTVTAK